MAVSKRLRYEVLRRDDHACRYCGAKAPDVKLTVDHVIPVALGGSDKPENLVTACTACNAGKSSSSPDAPIVANVSDDALRWARAMGMAADLASFDREKRWAVQSAVEDIWLSFFPEAAHAADDYYRPSDWERSIDRFASAGLTQGDLVSLAHDCLKRRNVANEHAWRYFCGACWKEIERRQGIARDLIDSGEVE